MASLKAFYFAWVDPSTAFNAAVHNRLDEIPVNIHVEQNENDFAALTMTVKNPRIGLLSTGRKVWAWLSWRDGDGVIHPLFYGRLIGIPTNILNELVQFSFTARPIDYQASKIALANTMRTLGPLYDPIWLADDAVDDPDTVLEARNVLWNVDRVTHAVTVSDNLVGEDGTEEFFADEVPRDSVDMHLNESPLRSVTMDATITWDQQDAGQINMGSRTLATYTGSSLIGGWPQSGSGGGDGWTVVQGDAVDVNGIDAAANAEYSYSWSNTDTQHSLGDTMSVNNSSSIPPSIIGGVKIQTSWSLKEGIGHGETQETALHVPLWIVATSLTVAYEANRARVERISFTLVTDVQPILTMPDEGDTLLISLTSRDVGLTGDIGDLKRAQYLTTDRGQISLQYLIAVARAKLLLRARAVEVDFDCRFERAIDLSLRKNAILHDPRFPGGQALGKIIKYAFDADSETGVVIGHCTFAGAVGYGGAIEAVDGDSLYSSDDYDDGDYQEYENEIVVLPASDVGYTVPLVSTDDDGMRFPLNYTGAVAFDQWFNDDAEAQLNTLVLGVPVVPAGATQATIPQQLSSDAAVTAKLEAALKTLGTYREIHLRPVTGGPFTTTYFVDVTTLKVQKQIDLESAT